MNAFSLHYLLLTLLSLSFNVYDHFSERKGRGLQALNTRSFCSLQTLISEAIRLHTITVRCGGMATTGQAQRRSQSGEGVREQIRERAGRQARKKHIILLCTVSRLNLHNSDTQQHKKGAGKLEMCPEKDEQRKLFCGGMLRACRIASALFSEFKEMKNNRVNMSYSSSHPGKVTHTSQTLVTAGLRSASWDVIIETGMLQNGKEIFLPLFSFNYQLQTVMNLKMSQRLHQT